MDPVLVQASQGEPISAVAERAGVEIKYKCKKGECGTCEVNIDGKWVKSCQTSVPSAPANGGVLQIKVKAVMTKDKVKPSATFFSPKSFVDGFTNNAFGVVGFVQKGIAVSVITLYYQDKTSVIYMLCHI
jgi:aerobic-type carbon monoxide dehydrogenase small subunit (CoxS/CutS family)